MSTLQWTEFCADSPPYRFRDAPSHARAVDLVGLALDGLGNALLHARAVHFLGATAHRRGSRVSGADHRRNGCDRSQYEFHDRVLKIIRGNGTGAATAPVPTGSAHATADDLPHAVAVTFLVEVVGA